MQRFRSYTAPHNATESQHSRWLGRWSISPVAAQNPLIHSAPLNRPHATNGGSCSRHPPCRPADRSSARRQRLEMPWSSKVLGLHDRDGRCRSRWCVDCGAVAPAPPPDAAGRKPGLGVAQPPTSSPARSGPPSGWRCWMADPRRLALKGVFDLVAGVLQAGFGLIDPALVLGVLVAGGLSDPFLGLTRKVLPARSLNWLLILSEVPATKVLPDSWRGCRLGVDSMRCRRNLVGFQR
jgi:hypothetical protein